MIPSEFTLFGEKHKVKLVKQIDKGKSLGSWDPDTNTIKIATKDRSKDSQEQTFLHELFHCLFDGLNYEKLSFNEQLIDLLSKTFHQYTQTVKYK